MKRFKIEWSADNWVKPKVDPVLVPDLTERQRREEPAMTTCGGWTHVTAPNKTEAAIRFLSINGTRNARLQVTEA
jgi:hypothetical protein